MEKLKLIPDPNKSINSIMALKAQMDKIGQQCLDIQIKDETTLAIATQNLSKANQLLKTVEAEVKKIRQPYNEHLKKISELSNTITSTLEAGIASAKTKIANEEIKRREEEKKKQQELEAQLAKMAAAKKPNEEKISYTQELIQASATRIVTDKIRGSRNTWVFELSDITKVPLEWLILDEAKVKEYLSQHKETLKEDTIINGVRFYKKLTISA